MAPLFNETPQQFLQSRLTVQSRDTYTPRQTQNNTVMQESDLQNKNIKVYEQKLDEDVRAWESSVDNVLINKTAPKLITMLSQTPLVLEFVNADKNKTIKISRDVINKIKNKHSLPIETIKQIPAALANPSAIFKSDTVDNSYVVMLNLKDSHGKTIIVPVLLNNTVDGYNIATSAYGGKSDVWFNKQIEKGNLRYIDNKKYPLPALLTEKSKSLFEQRDINENNVYTEQDLVKLKEKYNNTLYQKDIELLAPNGKPSNLSPELYNTVRTKEFKEWFGDWENDPANASKVVDENGEPLVVYHGTPKGDFNTFKTSQYFSPIKDVADIYQSKSASSISVKRYSDSEVTPKTYPVFLDIKNPFDTREKREKGIFEKEYIGSYSNTPLSKKTGLPDWTDGIDLEEFINDNNLDYDGLMLDEGGIPLDNGNIFDRGISFVNFNPNQIKSIENKGTFSTESDNIFFQSDITKPFQQNTEQDITKAQEIIDKATMPNNTNSFDGAREILNKLLNTPITNKESGFVGTLSKNSIDKILSGKASKKSSSIQAHNFAAANIEKLFESATINIPEQGSGKNVEIAHRFYSPFVYENEVLLAKITVKEFTDNTSNRIYSIEAIDIENPAGNLAPEQLEKNLKGSPSQDHLGKKITALVQNVKQAQTTLYQKNNTKPRGMLQFSQDDDSTIMTLFKDKKNLSTVLHESSHFFLHTLQRAYVREDSPLWVRDTFETLARELSFDANMPHIHVEKNKVKTYVNSIVNSS